MGRIENPDRLGAGSGQQGGEPIHVVHDFIAHRAGFDVAGPADHGRFAHATFECATFAATQWAGAADRWAAGRGAAA